MARFGMELAAGALLFWLVGHASSAGAACPQTTAIALPSCRVDDLLAQMTLGEKISLMAGNSEFSTTPIPRLGIPSLRMADGPNGIRSNETWPATVFPASVAVAATWNRQLAFDVAHAIGEEARAMNYQVVLGPALNIQRSPLGGRNFEYFSEDPYLAGAMAGSWVNGVQSGGVGAAPKHFAVNNQEAQRKRVDAQVSERALREIYLSGFGKVVRDSKPWMMMTAYNRVNGLFASENAFLLQEILRNEWDYKGVIVSDWGAAHSTVGAANAGLDLEMPGPPSVFGDRLLTAVKQGEVAPQVIDDAARHVLDMIVQSGLMDHQANPEPLSFEPASHKAVSIAVAEQAITLLKNDRHLLPLNIAKLKSLAIIGPNADARVIQGGGSSEVIPLLAETPLDGIRASVGDKVALKVQRGADNDRYPPVADPRLFSPTLARSQTGLEARYWTNGAATGAPIKAVDHDDVFMRFYFGEDVIEHPEKNLAIEWSGYFWPPSDGRYEFSIFDHNNISLIIDGKTILDRSAPGGEPPMYEFLNWRARTASVVLKARHPYSISLAFRPGAGDFPAYRLGVRVPSGTIAAAVAAARSADAAIVFVGTSTTSEAEGADRTSLHLYGEQDALVAAVAAANPNTIVVLNNGGPMEMPWLDKVPAVIDAFFLGGHTGTAIADTVFGKSNPSGKLPMTFPRHLVDNPTAAFYDPDSLTARYGENLLVGYRWYDAKRIAPLFPFGFGLSYTRFAFQDLAVTKRPSGWRISASLRNIGQRTGAEVAQLYVGMPVAAGEPPAQLKGFQKILLAANTTGSVTLDLTPADLAIWDETVRQWEIRAGTYDIWVGSSSRNLPLHTTIHVAKSQIM